MAFSFAQRLSALLFPERCHLCGERINRTFGYDDAFFSRQDYTVESAFCSNCTEVLTEACRPRVKSGPYGYPYVFLWSYHRELINDLILHVKTHRCRRCHTMLGRIAAHEAARVFPTLPKTATYIPRSVPLMRKYGFDQAKEMLLSFFEIYPDAQFVEPFYRDPRYSREQKNLNRAERIENATMSLKLRKQEEPIPERILVFDDIITSGATADAAAKLLYENGVHNAYFLFLASAGSKKKSSEKPKRRYRNAEYRMPNFD